MRRPATPVVLTLAVAELRLRSRDPVGLFWMLGFPLVFALLVGAASRVEVEHPRMRVGFVAGPAGARDDALRRRLEQLVEVAPLGLEEAEHRVRRGSLAAYVRVAPAPPGEPAAIAIVADPARSTEAAWLRGQLVPRRPGAAPVEIRAVTARQPSSFEVTFPAAILWGVLGCTATFAIALATERARGTYLRLRVAPLAGSTVLGGKALACFLANLAVIALLLAIGRLGFGVRPADPASLALAAVAVAAGFAGLTMLLAVIGRTQQAVAGAGWGTNVVMAMIGGATIPLFAMPTWMQAVSHLSPVRWGILALEPGIWRDLGPPDVAVPCAVLLAVGALCFTAGAWRIRRLDAR